MLYTVYKTTNTINNKEYVGFHKINESDDILYVCSENGSIFKDGYMGSGKLMKRALQKYGPINMSQELLLVTDSREEAEQLERDIVCFEWVQCNSNYNLSIGGNVNILFGEHNGFFGKKHTKETISKIQKSRQETFKISPFSWCKSFLVSDPDVVFFNKSQICEHFGIDNNTISIGELLYTGIIQYESEHLQKAALRRYQSRYDFVNSDQRDIERSLKRERTSKRFRGIPKTEQSNVKRSESIKRWIKANPKQHAERMEKINKNPEKIRKTAEKHRGMKRTVESRKRMSLAKLGRDSATKGLILIHNPDTNISKFTDPNNIPSGWVKGDIKPSTLRGNIWIHDPETKQIKSVSPNHELPHGWQLGRGKRR